MLPFLLAMAMQPPADPAERRALFEKGQARQAAFEQSLFVEAGFAPLETVAAAGRSVRRALFEDPYMMMPVPGVEIERRADGAVILTVIGRAGAAAPVRLDESAWRQLLALEGETFARAPYVPRDPPPPGTPIPPPPPICHGWIARFGSAEGGGQGSASWNECSGKGGDRLAFATEMARLAVATRPDCSFEPQNPFWSFSRCFTPRRPSS